jgi:hypothetical protein
MTRFTLGRTVPRGRTGAAALHVDLARLVDTRAAVMASSGGGKSWLFRLIAERVADKVQTILIDPEGEFATLREKLDILLVGEGGDLAADVRTAKLLARKLIELRVSAVIDLYDVADTWDGRRAYLAAFVEGLMNIPKELYAPRLVLIDEAHQFAPESVGASKDSPAHRSRRAVASLMSAGRKRGFGTILATQRISKLDKDALAEAKNIFIGQTTLDIDQQRSADVLGLPGKERTLLRDLEPGEFFAFGPALAVKGVARFHSAPVQTTHPQAGKHLGSDVPKPSASVREMLTTLGDLPAQAEAEARTLEALQHENTRLKRELSARPIHAPAQPRVEQIVQRIEIPVFKDGEVARLEGVAEQLSQVGTQLVTVGGQLTIAAQEVTGALRAVVNRPAPVVTPRSPVSRGETPKPAHPASLSVSPLPKAERSLLAILAQYPQGRNKSQLAILSGYAVNGGGFNNAISALRSLGFLAGGKDRLNITPDGLAAVGDWDPLPAGPALRDYWLRMLSKAERACLTVLIEYYPHTLDRDNVARAAGYTPGTGGVNNALSRLRTLELITGRDQLKASDALFE